ncbi:hypothetical protein Tco_1427497 [Tanacetum coccineum]
MKYFCYVKQAMLKFEKQTFSIIELNQGDLFRMRFEQSINERVRNRLSEEFEPLVKNVNLQLNCFEKSLVKEMKDDLKYVMSLEEEFDEACLILDIQQEFFKTRFESVKSESYSHVYKNEMFEQNSGLENENRCLKMTISQIQNDFSKMEAQIIAFEIALQYKIQENNSLKIIQTENENFVASLQIKNAHLKQTYKDLFESIQNSRDETNQCDDVKLKFDFDEIEIKNIELEHKWPLIKENEHLKLVYKKLFDSIKMKKKNFESRNLNDLLQNSLYDYDPSNVESESGEKNILFENDTSSLETKIKELEMTLVQKTKDFEDAKVDFSKKTDKFETYFEKLEKTKVVLERQLDRKIQDSNTKKDQFLKQIASLESKLASQDLISNQKEYSELRTSYNALKAKFDALNQNKWKSPISNFSTPKVSVSKKIYTDLYEKPYSTEIIQETTKKIFQIEDRLKAARDRQKRYVDNRKKPLEFYVAYRLKLPQELNGIHDTFHVSNPKKCLADETLHVLLEEFQIDAKLHFVEEPAEIMDWEVKKLMRSRILIIKVNPELLVKAIQDQHQRDLWLQVSMSKAFRAKVKTEREVKGDHALLCLETMVFKRIYVCLGSLKDGYRDCRRELFSLDGAFTNSFVMWVNKAFGQVEASVGQDGSSVGVGQVCNADGQFGLTNAGVSQPGADVGVVQCETSVGQKQGGTGLGDVGPSSYVRSGSSILLSPPRWTKRRVRLSE